MDRIRQIYQSLSAPERKRLKEYLAFVHSKGENKALELLRLIEKKNNLTAEAASAALYNDPKSKAFIMMKSRLFDRVMEFLVLHPHPDQGNEDADDAYYQTLVGYRRNMLLVAILRERKMNGQVISYLEEAVGLAQACNAPELEVDALLQLRGLSRPTPEAFDGMTSSLRRALLQTERDANATGIYSKFLRANTLRLSDDTGKLEFLETHIPELETSLQHCYSPKADYYLQMLKVNYHSINQEYESCRAAIRAAIQVVEDHPGLRNRQRITDPYFQLGQLELKLHRYEEALAAFAHVRPLHAPGTRAHISFSVMMLYAYLFKQELEKADALIGLEESIGQQSSLRQDPRVEGLFMYLKSCLRYCQGKVQEAWATLQEIRELNFDKEGWLTGMRVFEIMILIDRNLNDMAAQKLENLRKHITRYQPEGRIQVIYRLLNGQEKNGFNFSPFKQENHLLDSLETQHPWLPLGHEVVRFDTWYKSKQKKRVH